jgi:Spy/CpxP family protein refolding chaperone
VVGISAAVAAVAVGGAVAAKTAADAREGAGEVQAMPFAAIFGPGFVRDLNLTQEQRQKIRQIMQTDRSTFVPLFAGVHATGKALREAVKSGASDSDLQPLATKQADADIALLNAAEKTQADIAAVLTDNQRAQAGQRIDARIARLREIVTSGATPGFDRMEKLGDRIGATADQKAQAKQIVQASRDATKTANLALLDNLKATEDSITSGTYDRAAAQSASQQIEAPLSTVVLTAARTRSQLMALLTPDQRAQLSRIMSERRAHGWHSHPGQTPGA